MNKKIIGLIVVILIVASILGVVIYRDIKTNNTNQTEEIEEGTANKAIKKKILIAFFSRSGENPTVGEVEVGNTEIMAGYIADYLGASADTFKIDPVNEYPTSYEECKVVANKELQEDARPEFKDADSLSIEKYETIFIGYPIWCENIPMVINTFMDKYDFSNKKVFLFNTHEGSGEKGTYTYIQSRLTGSEVETKGLSLLGSVAREETSRGTVENWLKEIGF